MSKEIIVFVFGSILLLIGILGGGFELKELKIPKVGWVTRILASVLGIIFISYGISIMTPSPENTNPTNTHNAQSQNNPVPQYIDFTIHDSLTTNAVSEQLNILIDGKNVGSLTVSQQYPTSMIRVEVPQPGRYSYTIDGTISFINNGETISYACAGQGMIQAENGKKFTLGLSISGNTWLVTLMELNQ